MFGIQKPAVQMTISALDLASVPRRLETATIKTVNHRLRIGDRLHHTWLMFHPPTNPEPKEIVFKGTFKPWSSRTVIAPLKYFYTSTT
jgi:hypothetical protein